MLVPKLKTSGLTKAEIYKQHKIDEQQHLLDLATFLLNDPTRNKRLHSDKYLKMRYYEISKEIKRLQKADANLLLTLDIAKFEKEQIDTIISRSTYLTNGLNRDEFEVQLEYAQKKLYMSFDEKANHSIFEAESESEKTLYQYRVARLAKASGLPSDSYLPFESDAKTYITRLSVEDFEKLESSATSFKMETEPTRLVDKISSYFKRPEKAFKIGTIDTLDKWTEKANLPKPERSNISYMEC